jgi:hypothetical protein
VRTVLRIVPGASSPRVRVDSPRVYESSACARDPHVRVVK